MPSITIVLEESVAGDIKSIIDNIIETSTKTVEAKEYACPTIEFSEEELKRLVELKYALRDGLS